MSGPWIELTMPFTQALVHFYQVAAAQDKLVNNMSYIKQGSSHHCSWSWVILLTMCCFLSFQWLGWSGFSHPTNFEMALLACFCGLLENITKLKVAHSDVLILSSKNVSAYFQKSGCFMSSMLSKNTNQTTPGFFFFSILYPIFNDFQIETAVMTSSLCYSCCPVGFVCPECTLQLTDYCQASVLKDGMVHCIS